MNGPARCGIEALNVYCGLAYLRVEELIARRGLDPGRMKNLMMARRSVALRFEDPVTHAVNAARPIVERLDERQRAAIEVVITSTESGLDYSKSLASYVHRYLGLGRSCRLIEVKQACYAATAAVQLATAYVASALSPGAKVLVIATDVSLVDARAEYTEATMGTGAAALLVSDDPQVLAVDLGAFGSYSYETMDSARPAPTFDVADVDASLFSYLDCLAKSFEGYRSKVEGADFATTFDFLALHTPFAGLVMAAHRKMMRAHSSAAPGEIEEDFHRRVDSSLVYPAQVGNLCSGSLYLALCSILDHAAPDGSRRVGMFSYGSGCSSEFFSGVIDERSAAAMAAMRVREHLEGRCELTFDEYLRLLQDNQNCLSPKRDLTVDASADEAILARVGTRGEVLALKSVRDYRREYHWI